MTIEEILSAIQRDTTNGNAYTIVGMEPDEVIAQLRNKPNYVPAWSSAGGTKGLVSEYDPRLHPVEDESLYRDVVNADGIDRVTRVTLSLQKLAVKRMVELCTGIPVKRIYRPADNDSKQKEVATYMEKIFQKARIDSLNVERLGYLFASCEVATFWYAQEESNNVYGFNSKLRIRTRTYAPMLGDEIFPLYDDLGDMVALSIQYRRKVLKDELTFFDTYTKDRHIRFVNKNGWQVEADEKIKLMKIPAVYMWRPTPIWENTSKMVYEMEWALSRNGNYLRENSKPLLVVNANEQIDYGDEESGDKEFKSILQFPQGSSVQYVTWNQAVENLKYHITELRQMFFTQLQLPDWSYESMKSTPMSGESRKQLFIDSQLKVKDESGRIIEFLDREVNVVRGYMKMMLGSEYEAAIDSLEVQNVITPFQLTDEKDTISNLTLACGSKPIMSQREAIQEFGHSTDVDKTMEEITNESKADIFGLTE